MKTTQLAIVTALAVLTGLAYADDPPTEGAFWSAARTNQPPYPFNFAPALPAIPIGTNSWLIDDTTVDYSSVAYQSSSGGPPPPPGDEPPGENIPGTNPPPVMIYGTNDFWLEIEKSTNADFVILTLHNTRATNMFYQIHSTLSLTNIDWIPGEIVTNRAGLTNITFAPIAVTNHSQMFFRAVAAATQLSIAREVDAFERSTTNGILAENGEFHLLREGLTNDIPVTAFFLISGTASNEVDYTDLFGSEPLTNTASMGVFADEAVIAVVPIEDHLIEFDETVTLKLLVTNTYVINPTGSVATLTISDPPEELFTVVATTFGLPIGIDYHSPSNVLIVSEEFGLHNFSSIDTNGVVTNWSSVQNVPDEVKLTIVSTTGAGFTNGTLFFGNLTNIGRLLPDGITADLNWVTLTNG
jgi:hypothetical protein